MNTSSTLATSPISGMVKRQVVAAHRSSKANVAAGTSRPSGLKRFLAALARSLSALSA